MTTQIPPFFLNKYQKIWWPYKEAQDVMHSQTMIQSGVLKYVDLQDHPSEKYFLLYKDHLIRIDDAEAAQENLDQSLQHAFVMPITLAKIDLYEFENRVHNKHNIMITFQQHSFFLEAENFEQMLLWYEKLKLVAIQNYFLDNYKIQRELGSGAFATVYQGIRLTDKEKFAIKVFHKENIKKSPKCDLYKRAIAKEILVQRLIDNEVTTRLYEVYESSDKIYLIMELLNGGELFDRIIEKGNYNEKHACIIMKQLLLGLKNMHDRNLIHRDIKPENLIFKDKDSMDIRIVDFGLSEFVNDPEQLYKRSGTPGYVAPEILKSKPHDCKSDIFSAGIILYLLLTGCTPFFGDDTEEIIEKNTKAEICYDFSEIDIQVTPEAQDLLKKMLQSNCSHRYNINQCLEHPWFQKILGNKEILEISPEKYSNSNKNIVQRNLMKFRKQKTKNNNLKLFNFDQPSPTMRQSFKNLQDSPEYKRERNIINDFLSYADTKNSSNGTSKDISPNQNKPKGTRQNVFMQLFKCDN